MLQWALKRWPKYFASGRSREGKSELQWLMFVRLALGYFLLFMVALQSLGEKRLPTYQIGLAFFILSIQFGIGLFLSAILKHLPSSRAFGLALVVSDLIAITAWLDLSGSPSSAIVLVFLVLILTSSLIYFSFGAFFSASVASAGFGWVIGWGLGWNLENGVSWLVYSLLFFGVGAVGGYLSEELKKTSEGLQDKSQEIEKLTKLYEGIIEGMPTGLLTVDEKMRVAFLNPGAEAILLKNKTEAIGRYLKEVEPDLLPFFEQIESEKIDDESDDLKNPGMETELTATGTEWHRSVFLKARLSQRQARLQQTIELGVGKNRRLLRGDVAEIAISGEMGLLFGQSEGIGRVLLFQDVTKIIQLEEKLKQHEKLAAVGQLAAGIAHEIRNPLASMSASIQMLQTGIDPQSMNAENQKLMEIVGKEIDRLNGMISEFLTFVRPENVQMEPVDLKDLLEGIVFQAKNLNEKGTEIALDSSQLKSLKALGSAEKLKQVVWNLLTNAIQAMDKAGTIEVGCDQVSPHWVCFWVQDHGQGMTEEVLQHLYEPFFTTKAKGTGLGLATVYKIVEAHQGEIHVQSKPGQGTRFEVHLHKA